jgi:hypothetical protein
MKSFPTLGPFRRRELNPLEVLLDTLARYELRAGKKFIDAGSFGLVATSLVTGDVIHYLGTPGKWAQIGGPGNTFVAGAKLYGLSPNLSAVYQYVGNGSNSSWTTVGGPADAIAGSPTNGNLFALSPKTHNVWMFG